MINFTTYGPAGFPELLLNCHQKSGFPLKQFQGSCHALRKIAENSRTVIPLKLRQNSLGAFLGNSFTS